MAAVFKIMRELGLQLDIVTRTVLGEEQELSELQMQHR